MSMLTLTFDNGPDPPVTHMVLDTLAARGIKTTFFVVGEKLATPGGREAVERAHDEGHWIANHSYTHSVSLGDSDAPSAFDDEVTQTQELIGALAHPDRMFWPFCNAGLLDERVFKHAHVERLQREGYTCVMFDPVVRDWEDGEAWVDRAIAQLDERPWTTLVIHDIVGYPAGTASNGMKQLPRFLDLVAGAGHEIVQEIPERSKPIVRGELVASLDHLCN